MKVFSTLFLLAFILGACSSEDDIESGEILDSIRNPAKQEDASPVPPEDNTPACLKNLSIMPLQTLFNRLECRPANTTQLKEVNAGNKKVDLFLSQCYQQTENSCWCDHLIRPNPESIEYFYCTYGSRQIHQLVNPDEKTWKYAIEAVKIVDELEEKNILTRIIYNWWRPEPYNKNVGGSASRHPFGTSVDVRFESKDMQNKAFDELCKMRKKGRIRAIGYYSTTAIHFGIGDTKANTWGKTCP